jgi:predicted Rossmann fold flavoprotein
MIHRDTRTPQRRQYEVIIIGAGAAGLLCAAECGKRGRSVLVLDHASRTASKVRLSGGGRCNFTNLGVSADHYASGNQDFCRSALARFTPRQMLELTGKHDIACFEKEAGQIFCRKGAREIVTLLERECEQAGVTILLQCRIAAIQKDDRFELATNAGAFRCSSLVVATGGLSYPNLGASSFGHDVARQFGLRVIPPRPALVPFIFPPREQKRLRTCAGISLDAAVRCGTQRVRGNILFTHKGLSGPAVLQASLYWDPKQPIVIDLLPAEDILKLFKGKRRSRVEVRNLLSGSLPKRFVQAWLDAALGAKQIDQCSDKELRNLSSELHGWKIVPAGTEGYRTAEVTAGGVDTDELSSKTMEANKVPGLYFIGEVVDVTGQLGGFNLHWAWASGYAAGQYA